MCFSTSVRRAGAPRPVVSSFLERLRRPSGWCNQADAISEHSSSSSRSSESDPYGTSPIPSPPRLRRTKRVAGVDLIGIEPNPGPPKGAQKGGQRQTKSIQNKSTKIIRVSQPARPIRSVGENIGSTVGGFLGKAAQSLLGSVFGMGDYKVSHNSVTGAGGPPQFVSDRTSRSTVVTHREYVGDIVGSTGFSRTLYSITPTNVALFPWLSQLAQNYEEYRIHGMLFEFKTTSGQSVSSTNTALGTVIMATQYNPNDLPFGSKIEMENYEFATSGGPFENFLHPIECKPALTVAPQLFIQQPSYVGSVVDNRLTTFGNFSIATVGMQAANTIGELWVSYQIELLKPRISSIAEGSGDLYAYCSGGPPVLTPGSTNFNGNGVFTIGTLRPQTNGSPSFFTALPVVTDPTLPGIYAATGMLNFPVSSFAGKKILMAFIAQGNTLTSNFTATLSGVALPSYNGTSVLTSTTAFGNFLVVFPSSSTSSLFPVQVTLPNGTSLSSLVVSMLLIA